MIIRIATEGQYRVGGDLLDRLNEIDDRLGEAIANQDDTVFGSLFAEVFKLVRGKGEPVPVDELIESDLVLPSPKTTLAEARQLFHADGLVPDR